MERVSSIQWKNCGKADKKITKKRKFVWTAWRGRGAVKQIHAQTNLLKKRGKEWIRRRGTKFADPLRSNSDFQRRLTRLHKLQTRKKIAYNKKGGTMNKKEDARVGGRRTPCERRQQKTAPPGQSPSQKINRQDQGPKGKRSARKRTENESRRARTKRLRPPNGEEDSLVTGGNFNLGGSKCHLKTGPGSKWLTHTKMHGRF